MIHKITAITEPLKEHLFSLKNEFYFAYNDMEMVSHQIYHYFYNSNKYYRQYSKDIFDKFGISINTVEDEIFIKTHEIGIISSMFYLLYHDFPKDSYERKLCEQLENMNILKVITTFYQDSVFAQDLILGFIQSDFYSKEELNDKRNKLINSNKGRNIFFIYPCYLLDEISIEHQKKK